MIGEIIRKWCRDNEISITDEKIEKFERYAVMLKEWNEKINLTAITDDDGIAIKHFIDSISVLKFVNFSEGAKIIDIGTGAGFPGIPLKIMCPDINITLLDSLNKRLLFLNEVCSSLGIKSELIHARAEEYSKKLEYRENFDFAVSRAVSNLPVLCEYCIPYVKVGGMFISMKGSGGEAELTAAENAVNLLGGKFFDIKKFILPDESARTIICISKNSSTPEKYPRKGTKINKNPL